MPLGQTLQLKPGIKQRLTPSISQAFELLQMPHPTLVQYLQQRIIDNPLLSLERDHESDMAADNSLIQCGHDIDQWAIDPYCGSGKAHLAWQLNGARLPLRDHVIGLVIIQGMGSDGLCVTDDDELAQFVRSELHDQAISDETIATLRALIDTFDAPERSHASDPAQPSDQAPLKHRPISWTHPACSAPPDIILSACPMNGSEARWRTHLNVEGRPQLALTTVDQLPAQASQKTTKSYLDRCQGEAKRLIRALALRDHALLRVTDYVVHHQRAFLSQKTNCPEPLTQKEVARALGLSASTVSRALSGKRIQSRSGTLAMDALFDRGIKHHQGAALSRSKVLRNIETLIAKESASAPLSDEAIATHLRAFGVKITRRTITKYRQKLGIVGSNERRHMPSGSTSRSML